jgi:very-short-patch-repair endonuclease
MIFCGRRSGLTKSELEAKLRFQLKATEMPKWEEEYRFHDTRKWRFDFAWPDRMIAVEVEGGIYAGGRHTRGSGFEKDCIKYNEAALLGWTVLRVTASMIDSGEVIQFVERAIAIGE